MAKKKNGHGTRSCFALWPWLGLGGSNPKGGKGGEQRGVGDSVEVLARLSVVEVG